MKPERGNKYSKQRNYVCASRERVKTTAGIEQCLIRMPCLYTMTYKSTNKKEYLFICLLKLYYKTR